MDEWKQKLRNMYYYDCTVQLYNIRYAEEQTFKIEVALENIELWRESSILDLGCGTGILLPRIQGRAKEIVGLDLSKNMLIEAKNSARHASNIYFVLADADCTPLRNDYYDIVLAITLLQNMPNPQRTLQETKRIAKPNASIVVTALKKHFTEYSFLRLLKRIELKCRLLKTNENLKCHIAICKKSTGKTCAAAHASHATC